MLNCFKGGCTFPKSGTIPQNSENSLDSEEALSPFKVMKIHSIRLSDIRRIKKLAQNVLELEVKNHMYLKSVKNSESENGEILTPRMSINSQVNYDESGKSEEGKKRKYLKIRLWLEETTPEEWITLVKRVRRKKNRKRK